MAVELEVAVGTEELDAVVGTEELDAVVGTEVAVGSEEHNAVVGTEGPHNTVEDTGKADEILDLILVFCRK